MPKRWIDTQCMLAAEAIEQHREQLFAFVNVDVLNLRGAISALVARLHVNGLEDDDWPPNWHGALEWAAENGERRVCEHMTISLCAGLEVFMEDVFVSVCLAVPPTNEKFRTVKVAITDFMSLDNAERYRALWNGLDVKRHPVDRCDYIFGLLDIHVDIPPLDEAVRAIYSNRQDNASTRAFLREMQAVRNSLLHRRKADTRLVELAPARYQLGEPITVSDEAITDYGIAVHTYAGALGLAALQILAVET
jgi:hypothetical protein